MRWNTWCRALALSASVGAFSAGTALYAQVPEPSVQPESSDRTVRADTILYLLAPIEATAARERATAPPVATITVDSDLIKRTASENPYDLMRRVAGLEVHDQGQGPGFASNVVLRGFTADHSSDVLLVVDGVPVNLPVHGHVEGYADWNFLFPGAVSSLRVIHGPASPLHGDFAIAGAVELYTRTDGDGIQGSLSANGFGDASGWVTAGARRDDRGGLVGLDLRRVDGWRDNSTREIANFLARGWKGVGDGRIEGGIAVHGADWGSPGFLSLADFENGSLEESADRTDGGRQQRVVAHGRYAAPIGDARFLQVMGWGVWSNWDLFLTTPGHEDAFGNLYQAGESDRRWGAGTEVELSWIPSYGEFTAGVSLRTDRSEYDKDRTLRRRVVEEEIGLDAEHAAAGAYLRWRQNLSTRLGLDFGARVDHIRVRSFNRMGLDGGSVAENALRDDPYGIAFHVIGDQGPVGEWVDGNTTVFSPKLGARFALGDHWGLLASSSRGFRSAVGVVGDPDRPPFLAWAHEVGLHFDAPGLQSHLALFRTEVTNERIQDPITLGISSAGSSVRQGIEGTFTYELPAGLTISGRGTVTDAKLSGRYADAHHDHGDDEGPEDPDPAEARSDGQRVPGIARYLAQLSAAVPLRLGLEGRVEWRISGPYVPIGEPEARTDSFSVLDLGISVPIREGILLDLEVRNVLDRTYSEMRSSGYVNPGAPRSFGITINYLGRP